MTEPTPKKSAPFSFDFEVTVPRPRSTTSAMLVVCAICFGGLLMTALVALMSVGATLATKETPFVPGGMTLSVIEEGMTGLQGKTIDKAEFYPTDNVLRLHFKDGSYIEATAGEGEASKRPRLRVTISHEEYSPSDGG